MSNLYKVKVQQWLDEHGRDRQWLAKKCKAEMATVNSWFSTRGFSDSAKGTIDALMEVDELRSSPQAAPATDETKFIEFTTGEFEEIEAARAKVGSPARPEFYHDAILRYVQEIREKGLPPPTDDDAHGDDAEKHLGAAFDAFSKQRQPPPQGRK